MASTSADIDKATRLLRARQQEYYVQWVKDAIESERQRKTKLEKAGSREECKRLEKQFEKERAKDKERMQQIQEDHQLILQAKIAEWKAHGVLESALNPTSPATAVTTVGESFPGEPKTLLSVEKTKQKTKISKATLERLSTPAPLLSSGADSTQMLAFQKDVIRKLDYMRLHRGQSFPTLSSENLKAMSETDLLQRKLNLLNQLHGVVSMQERVILDDQCTVRSAVSSWKSADFLSTRGSDR